MREHDNELISLLAEGEATREMLKLATEYDVELKKKLDAIRYLVEKGIIHGMDRQYRELLLTELKAAAAIGQAEKSHRLATAHVTDATRSTMDRVVAVQLRTGDNLTETADLEFNHEVGQATARLEEARTFLAEAMKLVDKTSGSIPTLVAVK